MGLFYTLAAVWWPVDVGTGEHWGHVPHPTFCSKQRTVLFILRKRHLFLKEKVPSKRRTPKFEMIRPGGGLTQA